VLRKREETRGIVTSSKERQKSTLLTTTTRSGESRRHKKRSSSSRRRRRLRRRRLLYVVQSSDICARAFGRFGCVAVVVYVFVLSSVLLARRRDFDHHHHLVGRKVPKTPSFESGSASILLLAVSKEREETFIIIDAFGLDDGKSKLRKALSFCSSSPLLRRAALVALRYRKEQRSRAHQKRARES